MLLVDGVHRRWTASQSRIELASRLRAQPDATVAQLAGEFGKSERTVLRDLASLRDMGMPISGQAGPGGGVRLEGTRGLTAVHLSLAEVMACGWPRVLQGNPAPFRGATPRHPP
ncbi:helix-turn-helix transcriptional regulator [Roseateles asaccharophilus]